MKINVTLAASVDDVMVVIFKLDRAIDAIDNVFLVEKYFSLMFFLGRYKYKVTW